MNAVLWDLDGTLSNAEPFMHLLGDWPKWNASLKDHDPHPELIRLFP